MYKQDHFHSNTNEVLIIISPSASSGRAGLIRFGGPQAPSSEEADQGVEEDEPKCTTAPIYIQLRQGDIIIIPAGLSHAFHSLTDDPTPDLLISNQAGGKQDNDDDETFKMIGAYPISCDSWDMCYPAPHDHTSHLKRSRGGTEDQGEVDDDGDERAGQRRNIERVGWFERDPIYGLKGLI